LESGIKQIVAAGFHALVENVNASLEFLTSMLIGFRVEGTQQEITAMKKVVRFLLDIHKFSTNRTGPEL